MQSSNRGCVPSTSSPILLKSSQHRAASRLAHLPPYTARLGGAGSLWLLYGTGRARHGGSQADPAAGGAILPPGQSGGGCGVGKTAGWYERRLESLVVCPPRQEAGEMASMDVTAVPGEAILGISGPGNGATGQKVDVCGDE